MSYVAPAVQYEGEITVRHSSPFPRDRLLNCSLQPGDIVTVNNGAYAKREGLVVGSHIDYAVCINAVKSASVGSQS